MAKLLNLQEHSKSDPTQEFLAMCRKQTVCAHITLATERNLSQRQQTELWQLIDARECVLKIVAQDFDGQLEQIDRDLEARFTR
jgi:hypothetical protein